MSDFSVGDRVKAFFADATVPSLPVTGEVIEVQKDRLRVTFDQTLDSRISTRVFAGTTVLWGKALFRKVGSVEP